MSIFKETFRPFVFKQLRIREAIVKKGNNLDSRFGKPRVEVEVEAKVTEKMDLPAGSFFTNAIEKQCTIRMSSGVDLKGENSISKHNKFEKPKDLVNEGLAIRYVLEGGIPAKSIDFKSKRNLKNGGKYASIPRGDLRRGGKDNPNFGKHYGASYGDPFIRSDAKDGFGIVPMPGIIDASIRTKTAYGSLREAKVNFVCHNRRQLEIMELLYMRPGYPILLEWGWTPYISNANPPKKEEYFPYIIEFFKQDSKIGDIQLTILKRKKSSGGNYDGFVGYCKNFDIKSRTDGGYDCSTEIIAMGECLEGLKGKRDGNTLIKEGEEYEVDELEYFLNALQQFSGNYYLEIGESTPENDYSYIGSPAWQAIAAIKLRQRHQLFSSFVKLAKFIDPSLIMREFTPEEIEVVVYAEVSLQRTHNILIGGDGGMYEGRDARMRKDVTDGTINLNDREESLTLIYYNNIDKIKSIIGSRMLFEGDKVGSFEGSSSLYSYVRWDFLVAILNTFIIPEIKEEKEPIIRFTTKKDGLGKENPSPLFYSSNFLSNNDKNMAVNFTKTEGGFWEWLLLGGDLETSETYFSTLGDITDISIDPEVCLLPHQVWPNFDSVSNIEDTQMSKSEAIRQVGLIYLNLNFLKDKYIGLRYTDEVINDDFNLFDWLKNIWEGVNLSCVNTHNFTIQTELERPDVVRVIDMKYESKLQPDDLFEIKIQSNESIVRDFNFTTTLPSAMGATIAIAAQAPRDIDNLDSVTFAQFNKNIKYRFYDGEEGKEPQGLSEKEIKILEDRYKRAVKRYEGSLYNLLGYSLSTVGLEIQGDFKGSKSSASNTIKSIEKQLRYLNSHYSSTRVDDEGVKLYMGQPRRKKNSSPKPAIIPLKFTAQIDGIGGIVIGNVFKVQKNRLPIGYQGDEIAFVVMGENQKITAGQDWTTDITGQLILLDIHGGGEEEGGNLNETNEEGESENKTNTESGETDPIIEPESTEAETEQIQLNEDEVFAKYVKLNREYAVLLKSRAQYIDWTYLTEGSDGGLTSTYANNINDVTWNLMPPLIDRWEAFRPQFEEVFGYDAPNERGTIDLEWGGTDHNGHTEFLVEPGRFYIRHQKEESNKLITFILNGTTELSTYTELPYLDAQSKDDFMEYQFTIPTATIPATGSSTSTPNLHPDAYLVEGNVGFYLETQGPKKKIIAKDENMNILSDAGYSLTADISVLITEAKENAGL